MKAAARLALGIYSGLTWLLQPWVRQKLQRRGQKEPGYLAHIEERFGHYTQPVEPTPELVWVHAVSLGETRTAAILLKALRAAQPDVRILLTHGTATGRAEGVALLRPGDVALWQPWDSSPATLRFFTHFKPRLGLLMETEIWPNTVAAAKAHGVPLVLVNGRLSAKSLKQAMNIALLSKPAYAALTAVYAQTEDDARRFRELGAAVAGVFGNLKFDACPSESQQAQGKAWRQSVAHPVVMFASSREGEEGGFLDEIVAQRAVDLALPSLSLAGNASKNLLSQAKFLIVPRHPQRFDEVQALAEQRGLRVSRRSHWAGSPADSEDATRADVWLGDSLGEMALYYALSDIALLGGSFAPLGGQNLIEAAACGCPVIMGPHTFNFTEAAELAQAAGAARRVADLHEGVGAALQLIGESSAHVAACAAGLAFAARNQGASGKTIDGLRRWLSIPLKVNLGKQDMRL